MAHSRSALKRWRQNERARARNKATRTAARTAVRKARAAVAEGGDEAQTAIREAMSVLDRAAKQNVVHKNAAARHRSRLMKRQNQASGGSAVAEAPRKGRKTAAKKTAAKRATKKSAAKK